MEEAVSTSSQNRFEDTGSPRRGGVSRLLSEWLDNFERFQSCCTRFGPVFVEAPWYGTGIEAAGSDRRPGRHRDALIGESGCEGGK